MKSYLPMIIGMMLVTYLPRLLPLIAISQRPLHPLLRRFLTYIPFTALGALIVSGVTQAESGMMAATVAGISAAAVCSWFKGGLVLSVLAAIAVGFVILSLQ
jgi:branched-subunit amino acid transport protein